MTSRKPRTQPGFTRGPRIADLMTPEYFSFVESSLAAERVGDAQTALEYHRGVPMFTRSRHCYTLTQLAGLADEMTPWLWARWAAYQCNRAEDPGTESEFIVKAALDYTLRMFYDDQMENVYDEGGDPMRLITHVLGDCWITQQLCTFELGGLREFLDFIADGRLSKHADWARSWDGAAMRGLRLEPAVPGRLVVTDLATGDDVELLDLGAGVLGEPGGYVVGRLVPSGVTPGTMFDTTPVVVDRQTAEEVAESTRGGWITCVSKAIDDGRLRLSAFESEDRELASDIPSQAMIELTTRPSDRERVRDEGAAGRDIVGRSAFKVLREAAEDRLGGDDRAPYVAAAVLNPHGYAEAERKLVSPGLPVDWRHWASLVPSPAKGRLERLAEIARTAAA